VGLELRLHVLVEVTGVIGGIEMRRDISKPTDNEGDQAEPDHERQCPEPPADGF
jgi:hypothetical protein